MFTYLLRLFASQICSPFTICRSFLVLNWKVGQEHGPTFICRDYQAFTTAKPLLNNVLYHTVIQR